ncbi:MAG: Ser-tRNA(Ala) deacylase AlaX (editing enzyme) [Candidatus Methanohalarchaeum thermophilum]|uniref:Ser-tRNA(Ala) deacylase AlaX (Editing enzyme) n=1 Tax=Methanohalarchaeum thermophilum TaxID=1903181 RepID=A0A1Q6DUF6_METT1|nr:MAG: Ser-tRNA(Ala) deacylase AlaX (editing enzyme) [Candidatus Methanohalarchaeum thermophilum]
MTELIYFEDCYKKEFEAEVEETKNNKVILDKTAFYPEGGGQPSDKGVLDGSKVKKVIKKGNTVEHVVEDELPREGDKVKGKIDWDRRYQHMKYHTAQHILSAVVLQDYEGKTTGNQLYSDRARIDFDEDVTDKVSKIEDKVNSIIEDEREIKIYQMKREEALEELDPERTRIDLLPDSIKEIRIVEITDLDKTACAGTHVSKTSELGEFEIKGTESKGKGRKRIEFTLE